MATDVTPMCGGGQISLTAKAGELLDRKRNQVGGSARVTSAKTAIITTDGEFLLYRYCRKGKDRYPEWWLHARIDSHKRLRFRSKRASQNYAAIFPLHDPCDMDLLDKAMKRHISQTREFRRERKDLELMYRAGPSSSLAAWLDDFIGFDRDECLFIPGAVYGRPERVLYNHRRMTAARAMLIKTQGLPVSVDLVTRHKCGMGHMSCVNPRHLAWGTSDENAADRSLHCRKSFSADDCPADISKVLDRDRRLVNVIAWETRLPSGLVSAVKLSRIF